MKTDVLSLLGYSPEPRSNRINDLLVQRPKGIPFKGDDGLRRTLSQHELTQGLDSETTTTNTADSRESWVIPTTNKIVVNKPMEFTFREKCVDEVETTEVPDAHGPKTECLDHPVVLWVPVSVLVCPQSMRYTLDRIYNRASEVICRVNLPFVTIPFSQ